METKLYDWKNIMGELAAVATSVCWVFTSLFFTVGGREVGSVIVNRIRLIIAVLLLMLMHSLLQGQLFPIAVASERWLWLGLSGIVGLVIGDGLLFQAFVLIGPRLSTLLMALVPIMSTLLAWIFLGEWLSLFEIGAIALTVSGIAWVILERTQPSQKLKNNQVQNQSFLDKHQYVLGILCGIGGALGQSAGLILAKKGLVGEFPVLSGVLIRMTVAMGVIWVMTVMQGQVLVSFKALQNKKALLAIIGGSIVGPFLGVWLSLIAVELTRVGIASTLMSLSPVFILPIAYWGLKEKISGRAILGTLIALIGVTAIFLIDNG